MHAIIYGLTDPRTGEIRYIGKTVHGVTRLCEHYAQLKRGKTHKDHWLRKLQLSGLKANIVVLEEVRPEDLCDAEQCWIAHGRSEGWRLTNLTDGGEGLHGMVFSKVHRLKISAANKGRKLTPEQREKFLVAISKRDPKTRQPPSMLGRRHSEETRRKIGEGNRKKKTWSEEGLARQRAAVSRPVLEVASGTVYSSVKEAAEVLQVCTRSISRVLRGHLKQTGGHQFRYVT